MSLDAQNVTKSAEEIMEGLVEITLPNPENFLKVKETLTRIGVANKNNELFQSCHILQKRGRLFCVHFKELFLLDGKPSSLSEEDIARRNTIANLLEEWGLVKVVKPEQTAEPTLPKVKVVKFSEKKDWKLVEKYSLGKGKKKPAEEAGTVPTV